MAEGLGDSASKVAVSMAGVKIGGAIGTAVAPCAGTCTQCDKELKYIVSELTKISEEKRKYPNYTIVPAYTGTNDKHMFVSEEDQIQSKKYLAENARCFLLIYNI